MDNSMLNIAYLDFSKVISGTYQSGIYTVKVTKETFMDFPMFDKITFKDKDGLPFDNFTILINGKKYIYNSNLKRWFNINNIDSLYVEVFVFKDNETNPVLVRINNGGKYYYYKISESNTSIEGFELKTAHHYLSLDLFETLIDENEKINDKVTFRIDKNNTYNRIKFTNGTLDNFIYHKHEAKNGHESWLPVVLKGRTRVPEAQIFESLSSKRFDMTVYYRARVTHSEIPLLIQFSYGSKKYFLYKGNIHGNNWNHVKVDTDVKLTDLLEEIETQLFYSVSVSMDCQDTYSRGVIKDSIHSMGLIDTRKDKIVVNECSTYSVPNYVCYEHDLSVYNQRSTKPKTYDFGDNFKIILVNISNTLIQTTYNETEFPILFVEGSKFYVWFYKGYGKTSADNLPLMIQYYNTIYVPKSKEKYLAEWETSKRLTNLESPNKIVINIIKEELERVNFMLNSIDLNHKIVDTSVTSEYGIPRLADLNKSFDTSRIRVHPESYNKLFFKCTHRAKNGFVIRQAHYTKQIYYQKGTEEQRKRSSKSSKNQLQKCVLDIKSTEVGVYYFKYDPDSDYPLTVECRLSDDKYEYYVLQCDFTEKAEYNLRHLTLGNKIEYNDLCTILRHQNFIFHNVINIKLDKRLAYTCCDSLTNNKHLTFVRSRVRGPASCLLNGENHRSTKNLPFIEVAEFNKKLLYGYIVYEHSLRTLSTIHNEGTLANILDDIKIKGFQINNSEIRLIGSPLEGDFFVKAPYVFVYFYGDDPRPLLLCYNYKAYVPKEKSTYYNEWHPLEGVKKFIFKSQIEFNSLDPEILDTLNDTVGFLNTVNLYEHKYHGNFTYNVHTYKDHQISIKVTKEAVPDGQKPSISTCYKKLTHIPVGINGTKGSGFRLGNVEYNDNKLSCKLNYIDEYHKWDPLTRVSVYYYNHDTQYKDPLLVELQFETDMNTRRDTLIDYYKLKTREINKLEWEKDQLANFDVKRGGQILINHLDNIRYGLKKVLKIELDKKTSYELMASQNVGDSKGTFTNLGDYKVPVEQFNGCLNLSNHDYKSFVHKISKINKDFDYNEIGGLKFTLPGTNKEPIKILLDDSKGSKFIGDLSYHLCMGDVYVYFSKESDPSSEVPLFFYFNHEWYIPTSIGDYFAKWSHVEKSEVLNKVNQLVDGRIKEYINKFNRMTSLLNGFEDYNIQLPGSRSSGDNETTPFYNMGIPYNDLEIFSVNHLKMPPAYDLEMPSVHDLEVEYLHDLLEKDLEKESSIQGDQPEETERFKILNLNSEFHPDVKVDNGSQEDLEFNKYNTQNFIEIPEYLEEYSAIQKEPPEDAMPIIMASTGQVHYSAESNQSYLGSILGGTFGSLITIGLFTFMLFKYFRKVKIRNMIPNIY